MNQDREDTRINGLCVKYPYNKSEKTDKCFIPKLLLIIIVQTKRNC